MCTVLSGQCTPVGDLIEHVLDENSNEGSVDSSMEGSNEVGRARIHNESNLDPELDHMDEGCGKI